jgi:uncharacterized repeat protein (TIGR01451 family)
VLPETGKTMKTRKNKLRTIAIMAAVTLLGAMANVRKIHAATIPVTSTADDGSAGTLRAALLSAVDGDTIDATGVSGAIVLTNGELVVSNSISIAGPGPANLTVDANYLSRVMHIMPDHTVTIDGLTIANGLSEAQSGGDPAQFGGGIWNDHSVLTVSNCTLSGNTASSGIGGGIYSGGVEGNAVLTIIASIISGNSATLGGGILNDGGSDGGLPGNAILRISNSLISGNSAELRGGGILNDAVGGSATAEITASTIAGNSAGDWGGGISNEGNGHGSATLTVSASTLTGNSALEHDGGGIFNDGRNGNARLTMVNSTLSGNSANGNGGAIYNDGTFSGTARVALGNCTLSGNFAQVGGAIVNDTDDGDADVKVLLCTLSGNSASAAVGGIASLGSVEIGNTILKDGHGGNLLGANITSLGFNLSSDDGSGHLTSTGDQIEKDPLLGPLADNGGPTLTHLPLPGSPAIDKGSSDLLQIFGVTTDQRGLARTVDDPATPKAFLGDETDIGAVEVQEFELPNNPPVAKCKDVTVLAGPGGTASASIDDGSFDPDGDPITIVQTPPGPYPVGTTTVTLTVTDSHSLSNSCSATVTVVGVSDLLVSLAVDKTSVKQGEQLTYTITVHNFGPQDAANVLVNDTLSSGSTFVSAHANKGNFTTPPPNQTGIVTWNLGGLPNGDAEGAQLVVKVIVKGKTTITNTASASTDSSDPNPANNSAAITTTVAPGSSGGKK